MFLTQGQLYMFLTPELQGSGKTSDTAWECKFLWLHDGPGGPQGGPKVAPLASSHSLPIRGDSIAPDWMRLRNAVVRRDGGGTHMRRARWHCDRAA